MADHKVYENCPDCAPKHDDGREALLDQISKLQAFKDYVHGRLDGAGIPKNPGARNLDPLARIADRLDIALATQPAARRVTEQDVERAFGRWCDVYDADDMAARWAAIRAALESFAQPAEGVSCGP